ncbi:MAG: gluconolaconase [Rhodobacteraceae bacterium]|nr:gluconolaconase [Paracoccaceae bacterium]MAY45311.1 gluconolaconase [Paracoccaceae bacterium]
MERFDCLAEGLGFPEGPVVMPDGSVILCEIAAGCLTRIAPGKPARTLAQTGGGPNGAALGTDGALYVCNNGGFTWIRDDILKPEGKSPENTGGSIQKVDPETGRVETLYNACGSIPLNAPNDIVCDGRGGFWFTDHGHRQGRRVDFGAVYYAREDGSEIREVAYPLIGPNGIGLSPDGATLHVAETSSGRIWSWPILGPGRLQKADWPSPTGGDLTSALPFFARYDSLAIEACGNIAVATLRLGGINVIAPSGQLIERIATDDPYTTNIAFGGPDLRTAFITLSGTGRLVRTAWARPGLPLHGPQGEDR